MKKIAFLLLFLVGTTAANWACSCLPPTTFCDAVTRSIKFNPKGFHVIKARVASKTNNTARFDVLDVYFGSESRLSIRVLRDGFDCPDAGFGEVGETFIFALSRVDTIFSPNSNGAVVGDYRLPSCLFIKLKVEAGQVIGFITEQRRQTFPENSFICEGLNNGAFSLSNVKIAPNPVVNQLFFRNLERVTPVKIFDITGRLTLETTVSKDSPSMSIGHLASGMYIVRIQRLNEVFVAKIVKI